MTNLQTQINHYLEYCQNQKRHDSKTLKAYRIDLKQFHQDIPSLEAHQITPEILENYISNLHQTNTNTSNRIISTKFTRNTNSKRISNSSISNHFNSHKTIF